MAAIRFFVPGPPKGKGRPRASVIAGKPHLYTPATTREYEETIKQNYLNSNRDGFSLEPGPMGYGVSIQVYDPIPKSMRKNDRTAAEMGSLLPQRKPDLDNIIKSVLDALQGQPGLFADDKEVTQIGISRQYSTEPGLQITVTDWR